MSSFCWAPVVAGSLGGGGACERGGRPAAGGRATDRPLGPRAGVTGATSLLVILAKYRLDGRKDARALSSNSLTEGPEPDSLEDPRLEKLWHKVPGRGLVSGMGAAGPSSAHVLLFLCGGLSLGGGAEVWTGSPLGSCSLRLPQAKTSGKFSRDELDKLWREFQHHREKVQEYNVLLEALSRTEGVPTPPPSDSPTPRAPCSLREGSCGRARAGGPCRCLWQVRGRVRWST